MNHLIILSNICTFFSSQIRGICIPRSIMYILDINNKSFLGDIIKGAECLWSNFFHPNRNKDDSRTGVAEPHAYLCSVTLLVSNNVKAFSVCGKMTEML